ncbi:NEDD4-binding protein 2 isoform X2 [Phascolarctos cinereus]|uniref:NEDD4-binding protein 2 isoform X2 n=1 Tax=Phascolarctos cinereus TaxID=38626 RepID=A0A6P5KN36_PHACI|nr:NEDD4-binding protein 2 isoform X2 [Phascolarctos cinereus]
MPRKRKNLGGSPARKSLNTEDVASSVAHHEEPTALPTVPSQPSVDKEKLLNSLSEMFSDLDPDVVYLMLSECDFKVENAMDCLLELSTGAKGMSASKSLILESVATPLAFVNQHVAEGNEMNEKCPHVEDEDSSQVADAFSDMRLTEDLDSLIQNAFEKLNYASNDQVSTQSLLPLENNFGGPSDSGRSFSLQKTEMGIETFENSSVLSSDHLTLHSDLSKSRNCKKDAVWPLTNSSPMDAQPNSFFTQPNDSLVVYVNPRQTQNALSDAQKFGCQPSQACVRLGTNELRTAVNPIVQISDQTEDGVGTCGDQNGVSVPDLFAQSKAFGFKPQNHAELPPQGSDFSFCPGMPPLPPPPVLPQTSWNPMASAFEPFQGIRSFLAPVAASPQPVIPVFDYCEPGRVCASLPPPVLFGTWDRNASLPMPMAWRNQDGNPYQVQEPPASHTVRRKTPYVGQTLVLLRGLPGSGKSFLARKLLEENPNGIILSSDDYFSKNGQYQFDGNLLGEAHEWNRKRAKEALEKKVSPVIIDNTNLQAWEMKPYIILSQKYKYKIHFREPDTWWKFKPKELARRNIHGVTKEKIARMLEHYERYVSVTHVLDSSVPDRPEHTELSEHSCQEENISLKDSDDYTCLKENDLSSSLKHSEISEEKLKLGTNISSFQENMKCFPIVDLEKGEQEVSAIEPYFQKTAIQESGEHELANSENKEILDEYDAEEENVDIPTEGRSIKIDTSRSEENIMINTSFSEGNQDSNRLPKKIEVQSENCVHGEISAEPEIINEKFMTQNNSVSEKSPKHELLNFFGDWPVEKTMGQRIRRNKKTEKTSSVQCNREYTTIGSYMEIDSDRHVDQQREPSEESGEHIKNVQCNEAPEPLSSCNEHDTYKGGEKNVSEILDMGDWPLSDSLAQREHRSRIPKTNLNEAHLESENNQNMNETSFKIADVFYGVLANHEDQRNSTHEKPEILSCEPVSEKNHECQLSLTFTCSDPTLSQVVEPKIASEFSERRPEELSFLDVNKCSQTEPHDFALLWKIEKKKISISDSIRVLTGKLDGFKPKDFNVNIKSDIQEIIPYRVMYDKSTYVEESELTNADESENLNTLCKIFGSFSSEALKDLYERCNKDIIWATSLLLDSETKLCEENEEESLPESDDDTQIEQFDVSAYLKEIISHGGTSSSSIQKNGHGTGMDHIDTQLTCDEESKNTGKADIKDINTEKSELVTSILSSIVREVRHTNELPSSSNQTKLSGSDNIEQSVLDLSESTLNDINFKNMNEIDGESLAIEFGSCSLQVLPDIFKTTSDTLNEETAIIEYFEGKKNENLTKGDKKFQVPAEGYINEDKPEMEKIVRAKSPINLAGGINDESKIRHCEVDKAEILNSTPTKPKPMNIDCLELALPPELAFQLSELFGPVGIDSGSLTVDDCVVHIDLNLAKVIHEKWKESIMERQRQDEISRVLHTRDTSVVGHSNPDTPEQKSSQRTGKKLKCQNPSEMPLFMDHWNTQTKKVSLREIMSEEIALQEKHDMVPLVFEKNCAAKLKEKQLLKMFPTINQNFLMDIFKDNNYCLEQTVQFLNCVLEADPVKTVVAQEFIHQNETASSYNTQKSKEKKTKKSKETEDIPSDPSFQDFEYPKYDDYRAEAVLHQQKRLECYSKAKEAYRMGKKNVATFYAQQGSLHEEKMREANHLAAVEIFEKVNASLLPQNVLDLHGLHVDEAINHLITVLQQKTEEHKQNGGKPYLSVITGRGNHSQGGVARIKPAVIKYLTSHNFRFSEIKPGCLKVILK